ncbi:MAG: cation diffusion facilitator family transporter [Patescibacteria group bacterium]
MVSVKPEKTAKERTVGLFPVAAALIGNFFVLIIKSLAAIISGSSVLFSEAIHSFADTANQALLAIGLSRSRKKPDELFVYGYGNERFFWALISACGIFFIGAGVTVFRGITSFLTGHSIVAEPIIYFILSASFIIELATLLIAVRELKKKSEHKSIWHIINNGDPSTLAVLFEDSVAVLGVAIAFVSILLTELTGHNYWDATGSIVIGVLLGVVAITLIVKNRKYLIGATMPRHLSAEIISYLEADPAIEKVLDFKSTVLDIGVYRIKCEMEFNGHALLREIYPTSDLRKKFNQVKNDYEEFKKFYVEVADRIPRLVGRKIDEIEDRLKVKHPGIKYIDIEIN